MNHNIFNSFSLAGNVAKVNEVLEQANGTKYKYFTICQNNKYKNKDGEFVDKANFFDIKIFENQFEEFDKYLEKGKLINVFGKIQVYKNNDSKTILNLIGNSCRSLQREKTPEIFDYDWLNDDSEETSYGI